MRQFSSMLTTQLVRDQIDAYLSTFERPKRKEKKKTDEKTNIDAPGIVSLVEASMKKLRDLVDAESKKMIVEFAKDVAFSFESLIRAQITSLQDLDNGIDVSKIESVYNSVQDSFKEKYRTFFSAEFEKPEEVFFSLVGSLMELEEQGKRVSGLLAVKETPALSTKAQSQSESYKESPESKKNTLKTEPLKKPESGKKEESAGILTKLFSRFKRDDGFVKTDLGKDSSGMRWDPIKKKWCFDDDPEEEEVQAVKLPPTAAEIAKKKQEEADKKPEGVISEEKKEESIVNSLIKPRGRNITDKRTQQKAKASGPKIPIMTAKVFENINAQAASLTIEQQRELIIFELEEKLRAIVEESNRLAQEHQDEDEMSEHERLRVRQEISSFIESTLSRVYGYLAEAIKHPAGEFASHSQKAPLFSVPKSKVSYSQGTQTADRASPFNKELELAKLKIRFEAHHIVDVNESAAHASERKKLREFMEHIYKAQAMDIGVIGEAPSKLAQSNPFSVDEILSMIELVRNYASALKVSKSVESQLKSQNSRLKQAIQLLMQDGERKGLSIVQLQKKYMECQSKLYAQIKQSEVMRREKEILKHTAKAFLEESSHYQSECDRLSLQATKTALQGEKDAAYASKMAQFMNKTFVDLKEQLVKRAVEEKSVMDNTLEYYSHHLLQLAVKFSELQNFLSAAKVRYTQAVKELDIKDEIQTKTELEFEAERKRSLEKFESENKKLTESLQLAQQSLEDAKQKLANQVSQSEEEVSSLQAQITELKQSLSAFDEQWAQVWAYVRLELHQGTSDDLTDITKAVQLLVEQRSEIETQLNADIAERESDLALLKREEDSVVLDLNEKTLKLVSKLNQQEEELLKTQKSVKDTEEKTKQLEIQVQEKEKAIREIIDKLTSEEAVRGKAEEELTQYRNQVEVMQESIRVFQEQVAKDAQKIFEFEEIISKNEARILELEGPADLNQKLMDVNVSSGLALDELRHQNEDLRSDVDMASKKLKEREEEIKRLEAANAILLQAELDKAEEVRVYKNLKEDAESQAATTQNELSQLKQELEIKQTLIKSLQESGNSEEISDHNSNAILEEVKAELELKTKALVEAQKELNQLKDQVIKLRRDLEGRELSTEERDHKQIALQESLEHLSLRVQELAEAEINLKSQLKHKESELTSLRKKFIEGDNQNERLTAPLPDLGQGGNSAEVRSYLQEQNRRIELLLMDLQEAAKAIQEYKAEREDLKKKVLAEIRIAAETNKEAKDFMETMILQESKRLVQSNSITN